MSSIKKIIGGLVVVASIAIVAPAFAKEEFFHPLEAGKAATEMGSAAEGNRAEEEEGIVNWWSFDYGEKATDPSHHGYPPPYGWALVNFVVFLGILSRILWKPIKAGFIERHGKIKNELGEAQRLRKEAEAQLAEYTRKVAHVDQEVETLLAQLRKEAEADRARIIAAAEDEAKRLKVEADKQIQLEIERARAALRQETVEAALKAAEEILRTRITADDQQKLAERYLVSVEKQKPNQGGVA
ncbi:MAG: ATP synthase F0 subunit B [Polyangia bacterium]